MKKKAIALAVGALCVAPAAHSQITFGNDTIGTVQFYGKLYPQYMWGTSKGATQPGAGVSSLVSQTTPANPVLAGTGTINNNGSRLGVDSQNTYLGFRGERSLGSTGFKGIWQVEQSVGIDNQTPASNTFSNRNSFAGLSHRHGTIKLGNMDTIYKDYGDSFRMFGVSSGNFVSSSNIISSSGLGSAGSFNLRKSNSVQIESGQYSGFQAGFQYSPDEAKGNAGRNINANLMSYGVKWDGGPVYVSLSQEIHKDSFGGSTDILVANNSITGANGEHLKDTGTRLTAEYRFAKHRIAMDLARLDYKESGQVTGVTRFQEYKKTTWALGWEARWTDAWRTAIQYSVADAGTCTLTNNVSCTTRGLKGTMLNAGVAYSFDKQTFVYMLVGRLTNGESSVYDNWANGNPQRGADITQAALGVSYTF